MFQTVNVFTFPNDQKVHLRLDLAEIQTLETLKGQVINYPERSKEKKLEMSTVKIFPL